MIKNVEDVYIPTSREKETQLATKEIENLEH